MDDDGKTALERFARSQHGALTRWLQRSFGTKLTPEDLADVVGQAYADAVAGAASLSDDDLRPWMFRVARNRAIGLIRRAEGEGATKRSTVPLSALEGDFGAAALTTDDEAAQEAIATDDAVRDNAARVHRALEQLGDSEREVLRLCAIDGVSIRGAVELTGLSKKQVERTRTRALGRFTALLGAPSGPECESVRALVRPGHLIDPLLAKWRDAHLAGCLGCQVQGGLAYGKRLQSLAPLLPVSTPALGKLQALWGKLATRIPGLGELPPEAAAAGVATAGATSAGAGGLLAAAGTTKLAACGAAAVIAAAACVSVPVTRDRKQERPPRPSAAPSAAAARPVGTPAPAAASRGVGPATRPPRATRRTVTARRRGRAARVDEFSPESFAPVAPVATPGPVARIASAHPAPARAATPAAPAGTGRAFGREFSP